jgi:Ca2+/Na+ antiporter
MCDDDDEEVMMMMMMMMMVMMMMVMMMMVMMMMTTTTTMMMMTMMMCLCVILEMALRDAVKMTMMVKQSAFDDDGTLGENNSDADLLMLTARAVMPMRVSRHATLSPHRWMMMMMITRKAEKETHRMQPLAAHSSSVRERCSQSCMQNSPNTTRACEPTPAHADRPPANGRVPHESEKQTNSPTTPPSSTWKPGSHRCLHSSLPHSFTTLHPTASHCVSLQPTTADADRRCRAVRRPSGGAHVCVCLCACVCMCMSVLVTMGQPVSEVGGIPLLCAIFLWPLESSNGQERGDGARRGEDGRPD